MIFAIIFSLPTLAQNYINVGSTKEDVLSVMGEPTTISKNEIYATEIWGYGELGLATIKFKNNKVHEYKNYHKLLKIGPLQTKKEEQNTKLKNDEFWEKIKTAEVKSSPTLANNNLSGITSANKETFEKQSKSNTAPYYLYIIIGLILIFIIVLLIKYKK